MESAPLNMEPKGSRPIALPAGYKSVGDPPPESATKLQSKLDLNKKEHKNIMCIY